MNECFPCNFIMLVSINGNKRCTEIYNAEVKSLGKTPTWSGFHDVICEQSHIPSLPPLLSACDKTHKSKEISY